MVLIIKYHLFLHLFHSFLPMLLAVTNFDECSQQLHTRKSWVEWSPLWLWIRSRISFVKLICNQNATRLQIEVHLGLIPVEVPCYFICFSLFSVHLHQCTHTLTSLQSLTFFSTSLLLLNLSIWLFYPFPLSSSCVYPFILVFSMNFPWCLMRWSFIF